MSNNGNVPPQPSVLVHFKNPLLQQEQRLVPYTRQK